MDNYIKVYSYVIELNFITTNEKLVLSYILNWEESGRITYTSSSKLASTLGISKRSIIRALNHLSELEFILMDRTGNSHYMRTNRFIIAAAIKKFNKIERSSICLSNIIIGK